MLLQPAIGCKSTTSMRIKQSTDKPNLSTIAIINQKRNPIVVWFSKDSSSVRYFFGAPRGSVSIMHIVQDRSYTNITTPLFIIPYVNFVKVVEPGDSLIIISKDSTIRKDIYAFDFSSLNFMDEYELRELKKLGYRQKEVILDNIKDNE